MQLANDNSLKTDGIADDEAKGFTIKANGKAFQVLIAGLYSEKHDSVVREICSNAWDAHVAAGCPTKPFDITLPNALVPNLVVRDYGTGLSKATARHLFSTIFESTKDQSNDAIGAFGLGSKSPFAITDQFQVESRFNGMVFTFLVYKDSSGCPQILDLAEEETDQPNGVTVTIPVKPEDTYAIQRALKRQLYFFPNKPTVEGHSSDYLWPKPHKQELLAKNTYLEKNPVWSGHRVRMGPVSYPLLVSELSSELQQKFSGLEVFNTLTITEFPMGALDIQPSREGLSYIPQTKDALNEYFTEMFEEYDANLVKDFADNQETLIQAMDWVRNQHALTSYTKTIKFVAPKLYDGDIGQLIYGSAFHNLVKIEAIRQEEKKPKVFHRIDELTGIETTGVEMVDTVFSYYPYLMQSMSSRNTTVKKTPDIVHRFGGDAIKTMLCEPHTQLLWIDDTEKAMAKIRHVATTNTQGHTYAIYPNPSVIDKSLNDLDSFIKRFVGIAGTYEEIKARVKMISAVVVPKVARERVERAKEALGSTFLVSRGSLSYHRVKTVADLPPGAPFVISERSTVDESLKHSLMKASGKTKIIMVNKSATRDINLLVQNGHPSLEAWIEARVDAWRYRVFVARAMAGVSLMQTHTFLEDTTNKDILDFMEKKASLTSVAAKFQKLIEKKEIQPFIEIHSYYNGQEPTAFNYRTSPKSVAFIKQLNELKRKSKVMRQHPLMVMIDNLNAWQVDEDDKTKIVKYIDENFALNT